MKITLTGQELCTGFDIITSAVPHTTTMNVLKNTKLEVKNNKAELTTSNLCLSIKYRLDTTSCDGEDTILIPAARIGKIAKELDDSDSITLSTDGLRCALKSSHGTCTFLGEDPDNFPRIPGIKASGYIEIDGEILGTMLHKVSHSALREVRGVSLSGVLIKIYSDDIVMAAASTARLSKIKRKILNPSNILIQTIIPVTQLTPLRNFLLKHKDVLIKIAIDNDKACFWSEKGKFLYRSIAGGFIAYEDIFSMPHDKAITINKNELLPLIKTASCMVDEMNNYVKFGFADNKLTISTINNLGDAELTTTSTFDIPDIELYFNPQYILDVLSVAGDEITMKFTDNDKPVLFEAGFEHQEIVLTMNSPGDNTQTSNAQGEAIYATQEA